MKRVGVWMLALMWSAAGVTQTAHAGKAAKGDPEAGAALYRRYCGMCHSTEAGIKIVGPSLYGEMKGPHGKTAAQVRAQTEVGKGLMPSFKGKLDDQEMLNLLAYIRRL